MTVKDIMLELNKDSIKESSSFDEEDIEIIDRLSDELNINLEQVESNVVEERIKGSELDLLFRVWKSQYKEDFVTEYYILLAGSSYDSGVKMKIGGTSSEEEDKEKIVSDLLDYHKVLKKDINKDFSQFKKNLF